jgi:DNA-binding beta-propeller fold protein YncE
MAHPLALAGDKNYLYVIEGSSSSLRTVAVPEGRVNTLIGRGLFNFGSAGGTNQSATMQYPRALAVDNTNGLIWIADSYNHKVRVLTMSNNVLSDSKIKANFVMPSAIAIDDESVWIADSGANLIYRYYIATDYLSRITIQSS